MDIKFFTPAEVLLWATPPVIVAGMALLFSGLDEVLGRTRGYLAGFVFYWAFFCVLVPFVVVGPAGVAAVFRPAPLPGGAAGALAVVALLLPPALAGFSVFRVRLREVTVAVLAVSAVLALVNGVAEELLWRGAYARMFHDNPVVGFVYPALGFAAWHIAPLIVRPTKVRGGVAAFVAVSLVFGLLWGWVAWTTGSIALTSVSHVLTDLLGLGGFAYVAGRGTAPGAADPG